MTLPTRKKILFLITKSNWGGAQRYVYDLATSFDATSYEVIVACGGEGILVEKLKEAGIRTIEIKSLQRDLSLSKDIKIFRELYKILKTEQPEIFHINSSKAGILGSLIGRIAQVPTIIFTAHGWAFNENRSRIQRFVIKFFHWLTILFSHHTITVSKMTKNQMGWPGIQKKMSVIYNGINPVPALEKQDARNILIEQIPQLSQHKKSFWTGTIAELHPIKSHQTAIDAFKILIVNNPVLDIRHIIIGSGELEDELKKYVSSQNLNDYVFFAGHIHDASALLKAFDIFTLTSKSEALAYVIIEAGFAGLPIISTDVGGIPEIITHKENGLLIKTDNAAILAELINILRSSPELRTQLGANILKTIKKFSIETMVRETEKLYSIN